MKTLVIHPFDSTTEFLKEIYKDQPEWTILNSPYIRKKELVEAIKSHDRIIMLGHGTEFGLLAKITQNSFRFIIDSTFVYLLREKDLVGIWCNANVFFDKYKLKGFYTGMIVSEYEEALMYSLDTYFSDIEQSNFLFAKSVKESIMEPDMLHP